MNNKTYVLALLMGSGVLIFVQHARSGQAQDGKQYIALGIVGFFLLFMAEFAPELAFAFALLFFVTVLLNSPNGIPTLKASTANAS